MSLDLDPNYGLPLWQALIRYCRAYPPLVQAPQQPARRRTPSRAPRVSRVGDARRAANDGRAILGIVRIAGLR